MSNDFIAGKTPVSFIEGKGCIRAENREIGPAIRVVVTKTTTRMLCINRKTWRGEKIRRPKRLMISYASPRVLTVSKEVNVVRPALVTRFVPAHQQKRMQQKVARAQMAQINTFKAAWMFCSCHDFGRGTQEGAMVHDLDRSLGWRWEKQQS